MNQDHTTTREQVREYYSQTLQSSRDLKTNACCCAADALPTHLRSVYSLIDEEIKAKFYGCGSPIPPELGGMTVLDLGCGTGRDTFIISKLVGAEGGVIGVDMTAEQLEVARRHVFTQTEKFGFASPNVQFHQAYIEDLQEAGIADNSVDVIVSNCVLNLSPDKKRVFSEIFRVLKPGGELYFSDVFAGRRVPAELSADPVLRGECLGGALYVEDFRRLLQSVGCPDYRVVNRSAMDIGAPALQARVGMVDFYSMTVRAFKLESLEDLCEDYGQAAVYRGTLAESPHQFILDDHHTFHTGKPMLVCGNTAAMVGETRYARHFEVIGDRSVHFGAFPCGPDAAAGHMDAGGSGACY